MDGINIAAKFTLLLLLSQLLLVFVFDEVGTEEFGGYIPLDARAGDPRSQPSNENGPNFVTDFNRSAINCLRLDNPIFLAPSISPDNVKLLLSLLNSNEPNVIIVEAAPEYYAGSIFLMISYLRDQSPADRKDETDELVNGDWRDCGEPRVSLKGTV